LTRDHLGLYGKVFSCTDLLVDSFRAPPRFSVPRSISPPFFVAASAGDSSQTPSATLSRDTPPTSSGKFLPLGLDLGFPVLGPLLWSLRSDVLLWVVSQVPFLLVLVVPAFLTDLSSFSRLFHEKRFHLASRGPLSSSPLLEGILLFCHSSLFSPVVSLTHFTPKSGTGVLTGPSMRR